jgi:DNA-binding GntR family transcriptional regulator
MPRPRMPPEVKARLLANGDPVGDEAVGVVGQALVVEQVRRWIFEGSLRDGDAISQEDLAEVLGISRIPVRDGLIALAGSGWVVMDPGLGARAVGLDHPAVYDSFELLGRIWTLLIRRAIERGKPVARLVVAAAGVKAAATATAMSDANDEFVRVLRSLAASPRLDAAFANAARIVPGNFFTVVPHALDVQRKHVPSMGDAIGRRDTEKASALAIALHLAHARNIVGLLAERGVLAGSGPRDL